MAMRGAKKPIKRNSVAVSVFVVLFGIFSQAASTS
jgi:hypothetical protein